MTVKLNVRANKNISYSKDSKWQLAGLEFFAESGQLIMIKGESGIGKTSVLDFILGKEIFTINKGVVEITCGNYHPCSIEEARRRQLIGYVFIKDPFFSWCSIRESIESIGRLAGDKFDKTYLEDKELKEWGLQVHLLDSKPHELSSGQKRRFALVTGMAMSPSVLIIDEVFRGLDVSSRKLVRKRLTNYQKKNKAIVVVSTHAAEEFEHMKKNECKRFELTMGPENTAQFKSC